MEQKSAVKVLPRISVRCVLVALTLCGCRSESAPTVQVNLGSLPEEQRSFQPRSALATYVEFPGAGAELRVMLSSHEMSCDSPVNLVDGQTLVSVTFSVPPGQKLEKGVYPWTVAESSATDAGTSALPGPSVLPYVRLGKAGHAILPGGQAEITEMVLEPDGFVRGVLRLEQPGSAGKPATSILGSFNARWCRIAQSTSPDSP
jgi:hypothetical protein